ncbi:hypothetical protein AB0M46_20110 [Dactylosporangium sp. NPDC051485]|uniref:hypothetical protein n=1 Tax=Dactylosporangium sp. NPDC051485 TaxID=3154846 RepID=UPI00341339CC
MGVLHGLLVAGVIGLIAVAPCLICALLLSADEIVSRGVERTRRWLPRRRRRSVLGGRWSATRLGRRWQLSRFGRGIDGVTNARPPRAVGPSIEQVAGDLRRLNRLRQSVAKRSRVWFVAVQEAYDEGLRIACAQLDVEEHLQELAGVDLELERLRVEGELQRAGLVLRNLGAQQR